MKRRRAKSNVPKGHLFNSRTNGSLWFTRFTMKCATFAYTLVSHWLDSGVQSTTVIAYNITKCECFNTTHTAAHDLPPSRNTAILSLKAPVPGTGVSHASAILRILRGTKAFWSRFFPCNAHRRSVKKYTNIGWDGSHPSHPVAEKFQEKSTSRNFSY